MALSDAAAFTPHLRAPVSVPPVLDLLHSRPLVRIDVERTKLALALAFTGGTSGGLFAEALDRATVAPSNFQPSAFANDLFLHNFVASCLRVRIGNREPAAATAHLARLIASPPSDLATVQFRREILAELAASPELRQALERLYVSLSRFRTLMEGTAGSAKWDPNRRQLDVLGVVREIIDGIASGFVTARSGLSRLTAFGARLQSGEPYRSLCDLLAYDEKLATLKLQISVGADGKIRGFELLAVEENQKNPFVSSPLRRFLGKLELFARGFSFSDGEVMARLISAVFEGVEDDLVPLVQLIGEVEFYLGSLGFRDMAEAAGLAVCLPELVSPDAPRAIESLFNPLLLAHGTPPVPCDLHTDRHDTTVLVTGPNSGGKTRLLQSLGLTQLLAQSGSFVPARSARIALASGLVVSLIQETRADQAEGRLGMELVRIRELFERLPAGAMVILDELCSGTNPSEGEEIFELVVQMLTRLRPQAFITTHFLAFAGNLQQKGTIAELRFLQVALSADHQPTYQFEPGVARTSLASHAAARLGVTGEQLLSLVERNLRARTPGQG
jgi:DNA mismatch repair protein MutS2